MITDGIDQEVHVGDNVAYNHSGELRTGVVVKIVDKWRPEFYRPDHYRFCGYIDIDNVRDHITSRVKNHKAIVVIQILS